jgi:peptidoglycan/LPS O-acetylase OafA/YrhL
MTLARGPRYRPEIDGLRAVAVILVVLFHFGINGFSGGYILRNPLILISV